MSFKHAVRPKEPLVSTLGIHEPLVSMLGVNDLLSPRGVSTKPVPIGKGLLDGDSMHMSTQHRSLQQKAYWKRHPRSRQHECVRSDYNQTEPTDVNHYGELTVRLYLTSSSPCRVINDGGCWLTTRDG